MINFEAQVMIHNEFEDFVVNDSTYQPFIKG